MSTVPTGFTPIKALAPLADVESNELVNYIRTCLVVLDNGKELQVWTSTYGYCYHFNRHIEPAKQPEALRSNIGYTYIQQHKLSKQDILRYYGGDELVAKEVEYLADKVTTMRKGAGAALFRKLHNRK